MYAIMVVFVEELFKVVAARRSLCTTMNSCRRSFFKQLSSVCGTPLVEGFTSEVPKTMEPENHARNIAIVTPHLLRPGAGLWSAHSATFPIGAALTFFTRNDNLGSPECQAVISAFSSSRAGGVLHASVQPAS
jgi:hypothetical protein